MDQIARHIIFSGRVQGVGFRFTARSIAKHHQITGFVRNLDNGRVEMLAQGKPEDITSCIEEIQAEFRGYIRDTQIEEVAFSPQHSDFGIAF